MTDSESSTSASTSTSCSNSDYTTDSCELHRHNIELQGDIIIYDDYTPVISSGVVKAVDEICDKNNYSKEIITISDQRGYALTIKL